MPNVTLTANTRFRCLRTNSVFSFFSMAPNRHVRVANLTRGGTMSLPTRILLDATRYEHFEAN